MSGFCYNLTIGDVLASTLVMKLNEACRESMLSRKSSIY